MYLFLVLFVCFIYLFLLCREPTHGKMRHKTLIQEQLHQAVHSFRHLVGQNEWLNFEELVQRIRLSESLSEPSTRAAIMALSGREGIVRSNMGEITFHIVLGGRVLDHAS